MMNRNSWDTLRFLSRFRHHQQQNLSLLPSASSSSQFTSATSFHENFPQLQRNVVPGENKGSSFINPMRNSLRNDQLGGGNTFTIISGLRCTLILLSVCHHALPALPISIALCDSAFLDKENCAWR